MNFIRIENVENQVGTFSKTVLPSIKEINMDQFAPASVLALYKEEDM